MVELVHWYSNQANAWEDLDRALRAVEKLQVRAVEEVVPPASRFKLDQRLDAEVLAQMAADYEAGVPSTQLMTTYGLGKGSVLKLLREAGVRMRGQGLSPTDLETAVQLYESGLSLKAVGEHFGISSDATRNAFVRAGVAMRPRRGWNYGA